MTRFPAEDGIPFQENGLRYKIEPAISEKSVVCKGCKRKIEDGATRVGTSAQLHVNGGWLYRHLYCTNSEVVRDIRKTYQIDGLVETINHEVDDYSVVPRFNLLTRSEKKAVVSYFKSVLFEGEKAKRLTREEQQLKEVQMDAAKKDRRMVPIEELDWRSKLKAGELDNESVRFLKTILRSLGWKSKGVSRHEMLRRLKSYVKKEEDQEQKKREQKRKSIGKSESGCVISKKRRRKLLPELDLEAEV